MSNDTVYRVRTVFSSETGQAEQKLGQLADRGTAVSSVFSGVQSALLSIGAVAGIAAVGMAVVGHAITSIGGQAESTGVAIAGMLQAGGATTTWTDSMAVAERTMGQIRSDAAALPGEAQDFIEIFQASLPKALEAGLTDPSAIAHFTNQVGAVGISLGIDAPQIGRDLNLMLGGHAGGHLRTWTALQAQIGAAGRQLHIAAGSAEEFNHLRPEQRLQLINSAVGRYGDMISAFGSTWAAQSSTFTSNLKELFRIGSQPMFHEVVKSLGIINAWFSEHQKVIEGVARGIGDALGDAFARGREQLTIFAHRLNDLADSPAFRRFAGMVTGAGHAIGAAMQNGGTRAAVAGGAVGLMAGIPGLGVLAGGLYSFVTQHEKAFDETLMHLGAALMSLAPVVTALWETFAVAEEFLGSLFAAVLPGLSAGIAAIVSGISYYYTAIITAAEGIWNQVSPAILALGSALGNLFSAVGSVLGPTMIILTQQFISVATTIATTVIPMFVRFVTAIGAIVNWIADHLRMVGVEIGNWTPGAAVAGGRSGDTKDTDIFKNMRDAINSIYRPEDQNKNGRLGDGRNRDQAHLQAQAPGRTNVNVQITQTINDASDPDRVMIDTRKAIYQSLFHPIESHGTAVLR